MKDSGEECDGTDQCSPECTALKPAATIVAESLPSLPIVIGLSGFGSLTVLAYILRKRLHSLIGKFAGENVARSLDDIPLDQIEMPWHKW